MGLRSHGDIVARQEESLSFLGWVPTDLEACPGIWGTGWLVVRFALPLLGCPW